MKPFLPLSLCVLALLTVAAVPVRAAEPAAPDASLELRVPQPPAFAGRTIEVELVLQGPRVQQVVAATPGLQAPSSGALSPPPEFVLRFQVRPDRPGPLVLGPYEVEVFGRKVQSNRVTIDVLPPTPAGAVTLAVTPDKVAVGVPFRLVAEGATPDVLDLTLGLGPDIDVRHASTSTQVRIQAGVTTSLYRKTFDVVAKRAGVIEFGRAQLVGLAAGATVAAVKVVVR